MPAENLPVNFAIPGESASASYNWTDIADGTGLRNFYFVRTVGETTLNIIPSNIITTQEYQSFYLGDGGIEYTGTGLSTAFNLPQTVGGTAYLSFYVWTGGGAVNRTITFTIQVWDPVTGYTDISDAVDLTEVLVASGRAKWTGTIEITPTTIKRGQKLAVYIRQDANATMIANTSTYPSFIAIPFKINL